MREQDIILNGSIFNMQNIDKLHIADEPDDTWRNAIYHFLKNWLDETDFILANTSGSTGKPKTIRLQKQSMLKSAKMTNQFFDLTDKSTALLCLPASYISGKMMIVRALTGGYNLIIVEPVANPFENLETEIDFAAITPYQLFHSIESLKKNQVAKIIVGGSQVTSKLENSCQEIPSELYETYGMTETCSHIALRRFNGTGKSDFFTVLDGVSIRVDERGCLVIHAPHLLNDEIVTNDIVEMHGTNAFKWLGRADSVINTGGVKVHPEQIERKLQNAIAFNYFITSLPDEKLENIVVLVIESQAYNVQEENQLKKMFQRLLNKYEIPKLLLYQSPFTYSASNKVLRKDTLEQALVAEK